MRSTEKFGLAEGYFRDSDRRMAFRKINYSAFLLLNLFLVTYLCNASIENIDLNYTQPAAAFDELYTDGIDSYTSESWKEAVRSFQLALADYRHESDVRANCLLQCQEQADNSDVLRNGHYDGGSLVLYYAIRVRRCCDLCQERYLGRRSPVAQYIRDAFDKKEPYNYLQFCYFKLGQYQLAADAAFTYLERNPGDTTMRSNFKVYADKYNASRSAVKSLEAEPHLAIFKKGDQEYMTEQYSECTHTFEESLDEYYKSHKKCQALCEYQHRKHQPSFSVALFTHQTATVQCRLSCADKLASYNGTRREKFLEDHYHYLQFCYFEIGRMKEAAISAKTYLLFQPNDPIMAANLNFFLKNLPKNSDDVVPRARAERYLRQQKLDEKLAKAAKYYINPELMFANTTPELDDLEDSLTVVESSSAQKEAKNIQKEKKDNKQVKLSGKSWKQNPLFKGVKLYKEGRQLNGSDRFAVDNMSSPKECMDLIALLQKAEEQGIGFTYSTWNRGRNCSEMKFKNSCPSKEKLSKFGDGYSHNHIDPKHPFTDKETFEGVSIGDAVKAAVKREISVEEAELYSSLSDKMRIFVAEYFNLKKPLYIAFTHLVCRTASEEASAGGDHLSHPVHSDNCIVNANGPGTCPKVHPAYTWRDFSGILYLNDNFEGGDFIFADPDQTIQTAVRPKCGRMVAFKNGGIKNLHGVLGVKSGRRCALPLWFTYQRDKIEDKREKYLEMLAKLRKDIGHAKPREDSLSELSARATRLRGDGVDVSKKADISKQIRSEL